MSDIVARPDFPAISDLSVKGSEVVKKLAHAGNDSPRLLGFEVGGDSLLVFRIL
jgi:hypothetical protein